MSEAQQDIQGYNNALSATRQEYLALSSKRDEVIGEKERHSEFIKSLTVPFEEQFALEPLVRGGLGRLAGKGARRIGASERTVKALKDGKIIKSASSAISDAYGGSERLVGNVTGTHPAAKTPLDDSGALEEGPTLNDLPEGLIADKNKGIDSGEIANPAFDSGALDSGTIGPDRKPEPVDTDGATGLDGNKGAVGEVAETSSGLSQTGEVINSKEGNARISNVIEENLGGDAAKEGEKAAGKGIVDSLAKDTISDTLSGAAEGIALNTSIDLLSGDHNIKEDVKTASEQQAQQQGQDLVGQAIDKGIDQFGRADTNQLGQVHEQQMAKLTNDNALNQASTDAENAEEASNRQSANTRPTSTGPKADGPNDPELNGGEDALEGDAVKEGEKDAVKEGEKAAGKGVADTLAEDTAASGAGDEDPIGDVITAGLGIATLFATLFATKVKAPPPVQSINPSYQPGILE